MAGPGYQIGPGGALFDTPRGPLEMPFGPDAAAEMARRDAAAGALQPLEHYRAYATGAAPGDPSGGGAAPGMPGAPAPPEAPAGGSSQAPGPRFVAPDASIDASFAPPEVRASTAPPEPPPPGAAPAVGPALPDDWGKFRLDKPLKDLWSERQSLRGLPAGDRSAEATRIQRERERASSPPPAEGQGAPPPPAQGPAGPQGGAQGPDRIDPKSVRTLGPGGGPGGGGPGGGGGGGLGRAFADARGATDEAMRFQQSASEAGERSRVVGDERQAEILREQEGIEATAQAAREERMRQFEERSQRMQAAVDRHLAEADKMKVDPDRYFSSKSTGERILMGLAGFFAGFGGLDVAKNVNARIETDIRAQIEDRAAKTQQATITQQIYRQNLDAFKDKEEAFAATVTAAKMGVAKGAMRRALETGSPEQQAKAQEFYETVLAQQSAQMLQVAQARAAAAAKAAAGAAPKKPKEVMAGEILKDTLKRREGSREAQAALRRMQERDKRPLSTWTPAERAADQADRTRYTSGWSAMFGEGVTNEGNLKRTDETLGQSAIGSRDQAIKNELEDARQREMHYNELLRRHGVDPEQ